MNSKVFDAMLRHGIGFNPWYFEKHMDSPNYPPHNITQIDESRYRVTLAVAGFTEDELQIMLSPSKDGPLLTVAGKKVKPEEQQPPGCTWDPGKGHKVLYQGIAYRNFTSEFLIGENVEVETAGLRDGLLEINLLRHIPESQKAKLIPINHSNLSYHN